MPKVEPGGVLDAAGTRIAYRLHGPEPASAPTILLIDGGSGSAGLPPTFAERLAAATGAGVVSCRHADHPRLDVPATPRPLADLRREALTVLPRLLEAIGFRRGLLVGLAEGASIAAIYAGSVQDHRIRALSLVQPRFAEEMPSAPAGGVRSPSPATYAWDLLEALAHIRVPVQIIQGGGDAVRARRQIAAAEAECYCPVDVANLPDRDAGSGEAAWRAVRDFASRILVLHGEGILDRAA